MSLLDAFPAAWRTDVTVAARGSMRSARPTESAICPATTGGTSV